MEKVNQIRPKPSWFAQICSPQNILMAMHRTLLHGRRYKPTGAGFKFNMEKNILQIAKELTNETYTPGAYEQFTIYEPKQRIVLAAPLKDRVIHHAIHAIVEPALDKHFIFDSYACRKNKGTHKAIHQEQKFLQANQYFVHLDVKKYFPSINHQVLKNILLKKIWDKEVLNLFNKIIDFGILNKQPIDLFNYAEDDKGLPIGNLTSQFLANAYLNELDQYVKHQLKQKYYIRYMDDFVLFGNDKQALKTAMQQATNFCNYNLKLSLHIKGGIKQQHESLGFLGFKIYRHHIKLKSVCLNRFLKKYKSQQKQISKENTSQLNEKNKQLLKPIQDEKLNKINQSWESHLAIANANGLKKYLGKKYQLTFKKVA